MKVAVQLAAQEYAYDIVVSPGSLAATGEWAAETLSESARMVALVSNNTVFSLYGEAVTASLEKAGFAVTTVLIGDGERYKSLKTAENVLKAISGARLARTDAIIALGGGVVGDLAGFVSAIYLRGLPFLQIPTTLLAMIDSSVGGKTGVNSPFGKNLIGAFHQPAGVLIDPLVLRTLPRREMTAGLCEMVKHAVISGPELFDRTRSMLELAPAASIHRHLSDPKFAGALAGLIAENAAFKARIVAGDQFEDPLRVDASSRKILNFGHTLAHAFEKVTAYRYFKHGEAVGYGILFAAELSKSLALIDEKDVNLLNDVVLMVGTLPKLAGIDQQEVFEAFKFDKKNLSGSLQMVLLEGIGKPLIKTEKDIPGTTVHKVLKELLQKWA